MPAYGSIKRNVPAGIALVILGLVIFGLSGTCTGLIGATIIGQSPSSDPWQMLQALVFPLGVGGPFIAGGAGMLWLGWLYIRRK